MARKTIIDGFNFFHRWGQTRSFFRRDGDIGEKVERALRRLSETPPARQFRPLVVLDGGDGKVGSCNCLRTEYSGPGRTADEVILDIVRTSPKPSDFVVITSDRVLGGQVRGVGGKAQSVEDFLGRWISEPRAEAEVDDTPEEKLHQPSQREVEGWLDIFGDGSDILDEEV